MGWERKRGKLAEFNRFLRGGARAAFAVVAGRRDEPPHSVRYVITLDADTVLPPDAAPLLIGALAHPLNRAVYDPARGRVTQGYGILQPRVGVSLPSAHRSRFAAIHSGHPGVDPYTTAVSDVYQDLYGEGQLHREGHLRCRCIRAGHARPLSREPAALARPDRRQLRTGRSGHRHHRSTTTTRPATSPTLGASIAGSVATGSCCPMAEVAGARARRAGTQPALAALALEDLRQPAPQPVELAQLVLLLAGWTFLPGLTPALDAARPGSPSRRPGCSRCCWRRCGHRSTSPGAPTTARSVAMR